MRNNKKHLQLKEKSSKVSMPGILIWLECTETESQCSGSGLFKVWCLVEDPISYSLFSTSSFFSLLINRIPLGFLSLPSVSGLKETFFLSTYY